MNPRVETWSAVYRNINPPHGKEYELIALFKREEDANQFDENPVVYFHAHRRVRISPAPIDVTPPIDSEAVRLLEAIINGPDEKMPIDEAKQFLQRVTQTRQEATKR